MCKMCFSLDDEIVLEKSKLAAVLFRPWVTERIDTDMVTVKDELMLISDEKGLDTSLLYSVSGRT